MHQPMFQFLFGNIILSLLIVMVLVQKRILRKHLTSEIQYSISRLFLLVLALPFLPTHLVRLPASLDWFQRLSIVDPDRNGIAAVKGAVENAANHTNWMQDFAVSAEGSTTGIPALLVAILWITGVAVMLLLTVLGNKRLREIKSSMAPISEEKVLIVYRDAAELVGYRRNMELRECAHLKTPVTFGLFRPYIVIPSGLHIADDAIKCIFLHELLHRKHLDVVVNYTMCIFRVIYWFNPLVWLLLREMQTEREVVCDASVLKLLKQEQYYDYGKTILCFASNKIQPFILAPEMSGSKRQIKIRIQEIASFEASSWVKKMKSGLIFFITCLMIIGSIPTFTVFAQRGADYRLTTGTIIPEDLGSYFGEYTGSFVLYEPANDSYIIYNEQESSSRLSPISTYKIYDLLFALESGVVTGDQSLRSWDHTEYPYAAWNTDQDLYSAMKSSVTWYFQGLDKQMGTQQLQEYINRIGYGTQDISGGIERYWSNSTLQISPIEQVEMLFRLYNGQLDFSEENVAIVKDAIFLEESGGARLSGKTGTGEKNGKTTDGWFVGYVERGGNACFFATHIGGENANGSSAASIALSILEAKGIY